MRWSAVWNGLAWLFLTTLFLSPHVAAQSSAPCVGGRPGAPIKLEVFSDFQCPACRSFYLETIRPVLADYADAGKVCVVYREFPLPQHQHARQAARYGHAALELGVRQWAMVADALFASQDRWAQDGNLEAALARALTKDDLARLRELAANSSSDAAIDRDIALARQLQVGSTPTFFITARGKTEKVAGAVQYPILRRYLDNLLK
ncbi:MAG: thioredoxin domain-containing protein [Acidobacteria bacterium]|nr:thioredoxin domain-containing protein [Acidobacteriota bacterium]